MSSVLGSKWLAQQMPPVGLDCGMQSPETVPAGWTNVQDPDLGIGFVGWLDHADPKLEIRRVELMVQLVASQL